MELLFYYLIFLIFQNVYYKNHEIPYFEGLKLLTIVIFVYLVRKYIKNIFVFILLHIVILTLAFVIRLDIFCTILYVVFWVIQFILSFCFWKRENAKPYKLMPIGFIVFFVIFGLYGQSVTKGYYYLICSMGIFYYLLYLATQYLQNYCHFMKNQTEIKNFPYKRINMIQNMYLTILLGLLTVLIVVVIFLRPEQLGAVIGAFLFRVLQMFFSGLAEVPVKEEVKEVINEEQGQQLLPFGDGLEDAMPKNEMLLKIIELVFNILCIVLVIAFVVAIIYGVLVFFKNYMNKQLIDTDEVIEIKKEKKADIHKNEKERNSLFSKFNLTNSQKIRKMYQKKMKLYQKKQIIALNEYLTPQELERMVEQQTKDSLKEMTKCYETARYGENEPTKEDVVKMKVNIPK